MFRDIPPTFRDFKLALVLLVALPCGFLLGIADGHAATYFVSKTALASDRNDGSTGKPLRTIAVAIERARPGDVVVVRAGDYRSESTGWGRGVIPVRVRGQAGKTIQIRADSGTKPLIYSFLLSGAQHVVISGFEFRNFNFASQPNWQDMPKIVRNIPANPVQPIDYNQAWSIRRRLVEPAFATYFALTKRLQYVNGIDVDNCSNVVIRNNVIDGYWAGIQCRRCNRIEISNNRISHTVNGIFTFDPAPALTNSVIRGNTISQTLDIGISIQKGCRNVMVASNSVTYSGRNQISVQSGNQSCTVQGNKVAFGGYYSETMEFPGSSGINIHSSLGGNTVIDNEVSYQIDLTGIDGNGIALDLMTLGASVTVDDNYLHYNMGSGLNATKSPNALIRGNTFLKNGLFSPSIRNGAGIKLSRSEDIGNVITDNMFLANKDTGILSEDTLVRQKQVDRNIYFAPPNSPIAWDSFFPGMRTFMTIKDLTSSTGWEVNGIQLDTEPPLTR
jgi:parallel beta-helix repeat protein